MGLTVRQVNTITESGRHRDSEVKGLYLQVTPKGVRSWVLRYARGGRERMMGLGPVGTFNLAEARARARQARQLLHDGKDPLAVRDAQRREQELQAAKSMTFGDATEQYFKLHQSKWRNAKHRAQFLSSLKEYAYSTLEKLFVADIDTSLVLKVIKPIWYEKTETANRVRSRIESVLEWATVCGYRTGDNPARWQGHLRSALPARGQITKVQHHKALPFVDVPAFMTELAKREGVGSEALKFTILTAARTGEVIGARWSEIDLDAKLWTIPGERMKTGREHRVPLSDQAVAILDKLPREGDFAFPGMRKDTSISNMAMAVVLKRMNCDSTVHGFRSTFKDWTSERTNYPRDVTEMALAHAIGNKVEAAYRRGDLFVKRTRLMAEWARYCTTPKCDATVTEMRTAHAN